MKSLIKGHGREKNVGVDWCRVLECIEEEGRKRG
jgi:hypothetical protein